MNDSLVGAALKLNGALKADVIVSYCYAYFIQIIVKNTKRSWNVKLGLKRAVM